MNIFNDERASSVMFATLMLILIVITVGSAFAFALSLNEKQYMERQSTLTAQQNENLKIISIKPIENEINTSFRAGFNFTVFNSDINDAQIKAVSVNDKFMLKRFLYIDNVEMKLYNGSQPINVPAGQAINIHIGANVSHGNMTVPGYNDSAQPIIDGSGWMKVDNNTYLFTVENGTFTPDSSFAGLPTGTYPTEYITFPSNEFYSADFPDDKFLKKSPVKIELLTWRVNLFSKVFSPPNPIADVRYTTGVNPSLILDASGSTAPNGFITDYEWYINSNSTPLSGIREQYPYTPGNNYTIDLRVTDNFGMSSDLSERAGNITI